jgi:antitoxin VapB
MAISIKNDRAEKLARQVASETGESLTEAVIHSLEERLDGSRAGDPLLTWLRL